VLTAAKKGTDAKVTGNQLAEAYFFLGARRLIDGNRGGATAYFDQSLAANAKRYAFDIRAIKAQMENGKL
jgi:lipoprotein NlpI